MIKQRITWKNVTIVLEDFNSDEIPKEGIKNLYALDFSGNCLWTADLIHKIYGSYVEISMIDNHLIAFSGTISKCLINPSTGEILNVDMVW